MKKELKQDIQNLEERLTHKLTIRLGLIMAAGITLLGGLIHIIH